MKATPKAALQDERRTPAHSRKPLTVIAAMVAGMMALSGCAIQRIHDAEKEVDQHAKSAEDYLAEVRNKPDLVNSRTPLRRMDRLWVDTTPMPLTNQSLGAPITALDCNITFNPKSPITLAEFGRVVTNLCGLSVQVTQDATALLNGTLMANKGGGSALSGTNSAAISSSPLPPPNLMGGPGQEAMPMPISNSVFGSGQSDMISGISWVNKPLRGLLDLVTARLGLGWKFEDNTAVIYFTDTQIFQLYAIPGKTKMETTVKSGAESSSSSGESKSAFSSDGSSQETEVEFETDIMKDIKETLQTMVTPGLGRLSVSPSTGTVTVTDRPDVLRRVKEYIASENKRITRQVLLNVKVLSVQIDDGDSAGVNWKAVYERVNKQIGLASTTFPQSMSGGFNGSVGIINGGRWDGTELFIDALSRQGRVSTLSSPSVTTLNLKPAPILVGTQTTYLAQVSTNLVEGGGSSQQSLTPGTVTTGFNMTLLPYLMDGPEMLLQYSINLSSLTGIKTIESGENKIEMPEVDNRIFSQSVRLRSGETLVLAGFDQSVTNSTKEGVGDSGFWLLGGKGDRAKKRDVIVVLITPVVTD